MQPRISPSLLKKIAFTLLTLLLVVFPWRQTPLQASERQINAIVAVVNDGVITRLELNARIKLVTDQLRHNGKPIPSVERLESQVLETMINEQVQLDLAKIAGITLDDAALNQIILNIATDNRLTLSQFHAALTAEGIDYEQYREQLRDEIIISRLRNSQVDSKVSVSPQEVDHFLASSSQLNQHREYRLAHILIATPEAANAATVERAQQQAKQLYQELKQGANFETLAINYSNSAQALEGGDLGWRKAELLPTLFADVATEMQIGDISLPLQNSSGFHLIKLVDMRNTQAIMVKQVNARHILFAATSASELAAAQQRAQAVYQQLKAGADFAELARNVSADSGSAIKGGELGWGKPESYVAQFRRALQTLAEGEISPPFQTEFGWHILQIHGWRETDESDSELRKRAHEALHQRKLEDERNSWLRRLRDESYVEIRREQ
ncbi:MAG: peptidylprolyl isomerase [Gammaproteobacteria bacterium]|nr:peptidylprolyl isomerase [Gammaproteobacteria bacterium]